MGRAQSWRFSLNVIIKKIKFSKIVTPPRVFPFFEHFNLAIQIQQLQRCSFRFSMEGRFFDFSITFRCLSFISPGPLETLKHIVFSWAFEICTFYHSINHTQDAMSSDSKIIPSPSNSLHYRIPSTNKSTPEAPTILPPQKAASKTSLKPRPQYNLLNAAWPLHHPDTGEKGLATVGFSRIYNTRHLASKIVPRATAEAGFPFPKPQNVPVAGAASGSLRFSNVDFSRARAREQVYKGLSILRLRTRRAIWGFITREYVCRNWAASAPMIQWNCPGTCFVEGEERWF